MDSAHVLFGTCEPSIFRQQPTRGVGGDLGNAQGQRAHPRGTTLRWNVRETGANRRHKEHKGNVAAALNGVHRVAWRHVGGGKGRM